eukprot:7734099-Heterocapsa_arctica.AAC.1
MTGRALSVTVSTERDNKLGKKALGKYKTTKGIDRGVDEATTRTCYLKLAQQEPMKAGALHTIIADGAWTPHRAYNVSNNANAQFLLCESENAGDNHIWWECPVLNTYSDLGYLNLNTKRHNENNKP